MYIDLGAASASLFMISVVCLGLFVFILEHIGTVLVFVRTVCVLCVFCFCLCGLFFCCFIP